MLLQRLTLTKKEKTDLKQKVYENTKQLLTEQEDKFQSFVGAMSKYVTKRNPLNSKTFCRL